MEDIFLSNAAAADDDDAEWDALVGFIRTQMNNNVLLVGNEYENDWNGVVNGVVNHRNLPRNKRTEYNHERALQCIYEDFFGLYPRFKDRDFILMFRLSRSRMERIIQDILNDGDVFFRRTRDAKGQLGASTEAKILLPIKTFAYGVAPHAFSDYFQMSKTLARDCCIKFTIVMKRIYKDEYLRLPSSQDLKNISTLHYDKHGVHGIFGSLDCMHVYWKNCPKAWNGSYKKGSKAFAPSLVLEALSDHHLWFWHASFGYAGSLNDLNILNISPLLASLCDGTFAGLERGVVPYNIAGEEFNWMTVLVDGIYPAYSRFVKSFVRPVTDNEKLFAEWQESKRKDIERAFGVLQGKFQVLCRPLLGHCLTELSNIVACCIIMHNMCVSDRVMCDVQMYYNPAHTFEEVDEVIEQAQESDDEPPARNQAVVGLRHGNPNVVQNILGRNDFGYWKHLNDRVEHQRLHNALIRFCAS